MRFQNFYTYNTQTVPMRLTNIIIFGKFLCLAFGTAQMRANDFVYQILFLLY